MLCFSVQLSKDLIVLNLASPYGPDLLEPSRTFYKKWVGGWGWWWVGRWWCKPTLVFIFRPSVELNKNKKIIVRVDH